LRFSPGAAQLPFQPAPVWQRHSGSGPQAQRAAVGAAGFQALREPMVNDYRYVLES
jgi:hypothetical protein